MRRRSLAPRHSGAFSWFRPFTARATNRGLRGPRLKIGGRLPPIQRFEVGSGDTLPISRVRGPPIDLASLPGALTCSTVEMALFGTNWLGLGGHLFQKPKSRHELGQPTKWAGTFSHAACKKGRGDWPLLNCTRSVFLDEQRTTVDSLSTDKNARGVGIAVWKRK